MKKSILLLFAMLPLFVFGQEAAPLDYGNLVIFIIGSCFAVLTFIVLRQLFLWYWKIEIILKNQDEQSNHLKNIYNSIEENNRLTQSQIELVIGKDTDKV